MTRKRTHALWKTVRTTTLMGFIVDVSESAVLPYVKRSKDMNRLIRDARVMHGDPTFQHEFTFTKLL